MLLTLNNDIIKIIFDKIDKHSYLILGLSCKNIYKILKELYPNEKLFASLKFLTSNINLLKYAHENGCPWDKEACKLVVSNRKNLLKYINDNS